MRNTNVGIAWDGMDKNNMSISRSAGTISQNPCTERGRRTSIPGTLHVRPAHTRRDPPLPIRIRRQDLHRGPPELPLLLPLPTQSCHAPVTPRGSPARPPTISGSSREPFPTAIWLYSFSRLPSSTRTLYYLLPSSVAAAAAVNGHRSRSMNTPVNAHYLL